MSIADKLRELSKNLYWAWHPEFIRVFRDIQPELWREVNHHPVEFLQRSESRGQRRAQHIHTGRLVGPGV